jgi:phospholipid transport system transporter-binding protein
MADTPIIERIDGGLRVRGPVTLSHVQTLLDQSKQVFTGTDLRIDLSGVSEADSSAVALMLEWGRHASARGASIRFENPTDNLQTLIGLYDVGALLPGV